jgi:tetratricopeptide (TPR) repeat protein
MRWLAVITVLSLGTAAHAQKPGSRTAVRKAKKHYKKAETHYDVGEFEAAIKEYKEAYRLSQAPALLFNIAQAYRLAGNPERALYFYRGYLRDVPDAPNRADAEELAANMEAKVAADRRRKDDLRQLAERRRKAELARLQESKSARRGRRNWRIAGLTSAGLGIAALGAGTIIGLSARSDWKEVNQLSDERGGWTQEYQSLFNAAESKETVATAVIATGFVAVVGGGLLYWFGRDREPEKQSLTIAPGLGSVTMMGRF